MARLSRFVPLLLLSAAFAFVCLASAEEPTPATKAAPAPAVSLPLEALGYRAAVNNMTLRAGYTNATVHFIDNTHLLLTYTARVLIPRAPDQRKTDADHIVRALVLHLPDGKVIRQTQWRLHDHSQYLWPLAHGQFLLRIRSDLFSLDPLGSFNPEHLGEREVLQSDQDVEGLQLSPAHDLLLLETSPPLKGGDDPSDREDRPVTASFFRVVQEGGGTVRLQSRGRASAHSAFSIAFTGSGILETVREDRAHWGFDFYTYTGKKMELAGFTSTCKPRSIFVSDAEFFAYGCRGGEDRRLMAGFNLLAEAKWVFTTDDPPLWVTTDAATENGRFAVRNTLSSVTAQENERLGVDEVRAQEVRVYGGPEGDELLRVPTTPAQRPGGNFALSPDGLKLAILHGPQLEIYNLPPVSAADAKLFAKEQAALIDLRSAREVDVTGALTERRNDAVDGR